MGDGRRIGIIRIAYHVDYDVGDNSLKLFLETPLLFDIVKNFSCRGRFIYSKLLHSPGLEGKIVSNWLLIHIIVVLCGV